jgi:hypothetical protein
MPVRNLYKKCLAEKSNKDGINFPMRHPKAPVFPIPELNPEPTTPRGKRRRNGK